MRIIVILFLLIAIGKDAISQASHKKVASGNRATPSKNEIEAQVKEAKAEAQVQIKEMEAEIAAAKKNGENPETIAEMEKNLAMLKKMLGIVDKVAKAKKPGDNNVEGVNSVAPYRSPYIKFFKQPVVIPTEAQAKDKLLWYRGKKINQNTLITTRGRIIQYDRQNNRVLVQLNEKNDTNFLKVVANLAKSRQLTQKYINQKSAEKNSFFDYPLVMMAIKQYEIIEKDFDRIVNNNLKLPGTGANPIVEYIYESSSNNSGPSANSDGAIDPYIEQQYEYIKSLINNPPPLDVAPPPKQEYSLCYYCDPGAQERNEREKEIWSDGFNEYEVAIMSRVLGIERYYQLKGLDGDSQVGTMFSGELGNAWSFAYDRVQRKIEILKQRYGDDIYRYVAVVSTVLGWERQRQLLGMASDDAGYEFKVFESGVFEKFITDRIAANDYDVIFNYAMILGFARQKQLLGYVKDDEDVYGSLIEAVLKHNRFALTLDLDFELHMGGDKPIIIATGTMTTKQKIYLKLGRTNDCKWQFYRFDANYDLGGMTQEAVYMIPLVITGGTKKVRKEEDYVTYPYTGPTDITMPFPSFRISFCQTSRMDSAYMEIMRYEAENLPACNTEEDYCLDMLGYANKLIVSQFNTYSNRTEVTNIIDEMTNLSTSPVTIDPTGYAKLDKMQANFKANNKQQEFHQRTKETSKMENTVILFEAQNGSPFLINATHNATNSELAQTVKKGIIKLKVVNEPL
jgi:hypothetical protein